MMKEKLKFFTTLDKQESNMFPYKLLPDDFVMVLINKWYFILLWILIPLFFSWQALKINCSKTVILLKKKDFFF